MINAMRCLFVLLALCLFLCGCASILMPYESEPLCYKGITGGYCGSLSEVYQVVSHEQEMREQAVKEKQTNKMKGEFLQ